MTKRRQTTNAKIGRPPLITAIHHLEPADPATGAHSRRVTYATAIVDALAVTPYIETAAAASGVDKHTLHEWLKRGSKAMTKDANDGLGVDHEDVPYVEFHHAVHAARAQMELTNLTLAAQLAQGGLQERTVTIETDANGNVTKRTERIETVLPDGAMLRWIAEHAWTKRWGKQGSLELTGPDGGPVEISLELKAQRVLDDLRARKQAALEGNVIELPQRSETA